MKDKNKKCNEDCYLFRHSKCETKHGDKMVRETANCVRCGNPAKLWSGHVDYWIAMSVKAIKGKKITVKVVRKSVTAGWCSDRCFNDRGFCGTYQPWMGNLKGKQPSSCKVITSPKRNNMIHITWDKFYLGMGVFLTGEGLALLAVTPYLAFGLAQVAFGLYVIFTNNSIYRLYKRL